MRIRQTCLTALLLLAALSACGPTVEDQVSDLARGSASDETRQALLLAKDRAVEPLLEALGSAGPAGRADMARVLTALLMRTEDERVEDALLGLLRDDPEASVRADVAQQLGLQRRASAVPALAAALSDPVGQVRQEAMTSLANLTAHWGEHEPDILHYTRELSLGDHEGARIEALIVLTGAVESLRQEAQNVALAGDVVAADSLLRRALEIAPGEKRSGYALGRLHLDNGDIQRGQQILRDFGLLLDVPRLTAAPVIDGSIEDLWKEAAHTDSLWLLGRGHEAALPADVRSDIYVAWRAEGLYVAITAWDDEPAEIIVGLKHDRDITRNSWREDRLEIFLDPTAGDQAYQQLSVNSVGLSQHGQFMRSRGFDWSWEVEGEWAARVGEDHWSAEALLRFGSSMPAPESGQMWAANFVRCFRGQEFIQWARTTGNSMRPDQFGRLLFH